MISLFFNFNFQTFEVQNIRVTIWLSALNCNSLLPTILSTFYVLWGLDSGLFSKIKLVNPQNFSYPVCHIIGYVGLLGGLVGRGITWNYKKNMWFTILAKIFYSNNNQEEEQWLKFCKFKWVVRVHLFSNSWFLLSNFNGTLFLFICFSESGGHRLVQADSGEVKKKEKSGKIKPTFRSSNNIYGPPFQNIVLVGNFQIA